MIKLKKKVNPYRKPATLGDINKAKNQAYNEAVNYVWAIFFTVMRDKFGWGNIRLKRLWDNINNVSDDIRQGYVKISDLMKTLKEEAGIDLVGKIER